MITYDYLCLKYTYFFINELLSSIRVVKSEL